jgi:hypothetical protein
MVLRARVRFLAGVCLTGSLCVALAVLDEARGQQKTPRGGGGGERLIPEKDFDKERDEFKLFQSLRGGDPPVSATNKATIDRGAQWYAYRLTHVEYHQDGDATKSATKSMHDVVREALQQIVDPRRATPQQQAFRDEFGKQMTLRLSEVLKNPKPITRVNAGILLARLAETGTEDVVKVCTEVLKNPKEIDAVKHWAAITLKHYFAVKRKANPTLRPGMAIREADAAAVLALLEYVSRPPPFSEGTPKDEVAAYSFVRAEGYRALAESRYPAVVKIEQGKPELLGPTALVLLKVLFQDGVTPEPTVVERIEAAVGVCQMNSKILTGDYYQADYAAWLLGQFIARLAEIYNQERQAVDGKPTEPWKIHAARLAQALSDLQADVDRTPASGYVKQMLPQALPILKEIEGGRTTPNPASLAAWLGQNPPKNTTVYRGVETAVVKTGEKTEN